MVVCGLFVMNNIASGQLATGAFEVYLDDNLVWSRMATGEFPRYSDLDSAITQFLPDLQMVEGFGGAQ